MAIRLTNSSEKEHHLKQYFDESFLRKKKLFLFDGDGVLYAGDSALPGSSDLLSRLREIGCLCVLVTNNSTMTKSMIKAKLAKMGILLENEEIFTSAYTASEYVSQECGRNASVYVVGEKGIADACSVSGLEVVSDVEERPPAAVIVGLDRSFSFSKLRSGMHAVRSGGARFVVTNEDKTFPERNGGLSPGAGAIVESFVACIGRRPDFVAGKPSPHLYTAVLEKFSATPEEAVFVGDRLETDILGAVGCGIDTILVCTGIARGYDQSDIGAMRQKHNAPTWIVQGLPDVLGALKS